jgi:hypothetical protein
MRQSIARRSSETTSANSADWQTHAMAQDKNAFDAQADIAKALMDRQPCPRPTKVGSPPALRGANDSNLGILGESKRVFHIDPQIADRILDLAMTKHDLVGARSSPTKPGFSCLRTALGGSWKTSAL